MSAGAGSPAPEWLTQAVTCEPWRLRPMTPEHLRTCGFCEIRRESAKLVLEGLAQEMEADARALFDVVSVESEQKARWGFTGQALYASTQATELRALAARLEETP